MITQTITVRNRFPGEEIPEGLIDDSLRPLLIDPDWQWLVEADGKIVAQVLACNAHGLLMFLRITATTDAPKMWAVVALRQILAECRTRGCFGFMAMLEDKRPQEVKLMRIVQKLGGYIAPFYGSIVAGGTEIGY